MICNEENKVEEKSGPTEARGESMTLRLTFGVLPWTLEDTDLRWHVSCQSPRDKLSLWSRIFLYFVCAQMLGSLLQVSSTYLKNKKKSRRPKNTPRKPQQHGDRDHREMTCDETRPTRLTTLGRFHRSRVCGNRPRTALTISKNDECHTHKYTHRQTN